MQFPTGGIARERFCEKALNRFNYGADSIVWMKEDVLKSFSFDFERPKDNLSGEFLFSGRI